MKGGIQMKKEYYLDPEVDIIRLSQEDVITTSPTGEGEEEDPDF